MRDFVFSKKRTRCPVCGSSDGFAKIEGVGMFNFGKCHSCGAFIAPPKEKPANIPKAPKPMPKSTIYVSSIDLQRAQSLLETNVFFRFLAQFRIPLQHFIDWNIGADAFGNTLFFYVDEQNRIHTAKRIKYKDDLHRDKKVNPMYVYPKSKGYNTDLVFGQHQLSGNIQPIIFVESEKSAFLASYILPNRIWLATGGTNGLSLPKIERLKKLIPKSKSIYIMFDADEPGRVRAKETEKKLSAYFSNVKIYDPYNTRSDGYDVGDKTIESLTELNEKINSLNEDDRDLFEERAALFEYMDGFTRYKAEIMALERIGHDSNG